jgi:hypothetical protein
VPRVDTFIGAGNGSDGLIAVTDNEVLIASVDPAAAAPIAKAMAEGGYDLPKARRVPFRQLASLQTNKHRDVITFTVGDPRKSETEVATFASPELRDQALAAIETRVQGLFTRTEVQFGTARAVGIPMAWTVAVLVLTWVFAQAAAELQNGADIDTRRAKTALVAAILSMVGPVGMSAVGLLLGAFTAHWTWQRWQKPPLIIRLTRK